MSDDTRPEATCVFCGCTDSQACPLGCSWILVNRRLQIGVCSSCDRPEARAKYAQEVKEREVKHVHQ